MVHQIINTIRLSIKLNEHTHKTNLSKLYPNKNYATPQTPAPKQKTKTNPKPNNPQNTPTKPHRPQSRNL
jgi:hypothetical protein